MQTFLPYEDSRLCAKVLDIKRHGNQRNEALTILKNVLGISTSWQHHPAVKMWMPYPGWLAHYGIIICETYSFYDSVADQFRAFDLPLGEKPWWLGDERLHSSHRSNLLRKDKLWYSRYGWSESDDIPYFWPVVHDPRSFTKSSNPSLAEEKSTQERSTSTGNLCSRYSWRSIEQAKRAVQQNI